MKNQTYKIPYGKSHLEFSLPSTMQVAVAVSQEAKPLQNVEAAIREALDHPIGTPPLRELAHPGDRACIVFTGITRAPSYLFFARHPKIRQ
jgi:nickel-dependent lactate racemase